MKQMNEQTNLNKFRLLIILLTHLSQKMIENTIKIDPQSQSPRLPLIFQKTKHLHQQSHKQMYREDSQSSNLTINVQQMNSLLKKEEKRKTILEHSNAQKGKANAESLKKYMNKNRIVQNINSLKISKDKNHEFSIKNIPELNMQKKNILINTIGNEIRFQPNPRQRSLQKIYLAAKKTENPNSTRYKKSLPKNKKGFSILARSSQSKYTKRLVDQQVQTQMVGNEKRMKRNRLLKFEQKKQGRYPQVNTINVMQKLNEQSRKLSSKRTKFTSLNQILEKGNEQIQSSERQMIERNKDKEQAQLLKNQALEKDNQEVQPLKKLSQIRQNNMNTKYLINQSFSAQQSTAPSLSTNTYLDSISKLSSQFSVDMRKMTNKRYDYSEISEKQDNTSPEKKIEMQVAENISNRQLQNNSIKKEKDKKEKEKESIAIESDNQVLTPYQLQNKTKKQQAHQISLYIVPQISQTIKSQWGHSRLGSFNQLSIVNQKSERLSPQQPHDNTRKKYPQPKDQSLYNQEMKYNLSKTKNDEMMQFPQISELTISPTTNQPIFKNRLAHPIRRNFEQKGINWITDSYAPRSKILKMIHLQNFVIKKYKNGVYFGELMDNRKHGYGIVFYFDGKLFQGKFQNDLKIGDGFEEFPDGSKYQGQFSQGLKNGKGVFQWPNGEVYEGQWLNGKKHGSGIWKNPSGQSYIGEWKNGKPQGFGVYVSKLNDVYEGQFQNSYKQGFGTQRYHNGETYVGEYRKNRPNGKGEYFWTNGNYYKGEFVNHLRHGQGYFQDVKSQQKYQGQYKNDKKCGFGELHSRQGTYVGNFQNDYRHGYGEFYQNEECKFKGYWINDEFLDETQKIENTNENICHHQKEHARPQKSVFQKNGMSNHRQNAKVNISSQAKIIERQKTKNFREKSLQTKNKSIQSLETSLQKSNYKRSCGCSKKH